MDIDLHTIVICRQGDIRLMGGANGTIGRVEVCNANAWGTICGHFLWGDVDARIACRQLGFVAQGFQTQKLFGKKMFNTWFVYFC